MRATGARLKIATAAQPPDNRMRCPSMSAVRFAFAAVALLFLACVVVQFFLAGLGVFAGAENFEVHRQFGYLFGWLTVIMLVLAAVGRLGLRWIGLSVLLFLLFLMRSGFWVLPGAR